jgi:hypothetical protein
LSSKTTELLIITPSKNLISYNSNTTSDTITNTTQQKGNLVQGKVVLEIKQLNTTLRGRVGEWRYSPNILNLGGS